MPQLGSNEALLDPNARQNTHAPFRKEMKILYNVKKEKAVIRGVTPDNLQTCLESIGLDFLLK